MKIPKKIVKSDSRGTKNVLISIVAWKKLKYASAETGQRIGWIMEYLINESL